MLLPISYFYILTDQPETGKDQGIRFVSYVFF